MLFLVTMSHSAEKCPANDPEKMRETIEIVDKIEPMAKELNIKIHFMVLSGLGHTTSVLVEADSIDALSRFFGTIPFPQEFTLTPVEHLQDAMKRAKEMLEQQK